MRVVNKEDVRPPAVADMFYPGEPETLDREVERLLREADSPAVNGEIKALVCPHAGYMYSGPVAAAGYKLLLERDYSVAAVLSPSHRDWFPGVSVFTGRGYETPLGLVKVASELAEALLEQDAAIRSSWAGHVKEHALEVQLPFLHKVLPGVPILPIVLGEQSAETCQMLGEALAAVLRDIPSLIIASSDLSHYHRYDEAVAIDSHTIELLESFDALRFLQALQQGEIQACGGGAIAAAMIAGKKLGADKVDALLYRNSGDATGDHSAVVGYVSAAMYKSC